MNDLSPEEFEQLRRKELEALQAAAAKTPPRIWNRVFRKRTEADAVSLVGTVGPVTFTIPPQPSGLDEFIWVPIQPYESLLEMVARIDMACGQAAQHALCGECERGSTPRWGGFDLNGRQIWLHQIQVANELSWLDQLARRFGYHKPDKIHHQETIVCPASVMIQLFKVLDVPATMPGVNTGAYPPDPKPYGDPMAHRMGDE
jgi:hypothetical protein